MSNLADYIERYILSKLTGDEDEVTMLKRNELAEELECAPSQISYVLSTRFTVSRGFVVESRRGSGGFIRILRVPLQAVAYEEAARAVDDDSDPVEVARLLRRLQLGGVISAREADLLQYFYQMAGEHLDPRDRTIILRALLRRLIDFAEGGD